MRGKTQHYIDTFHSIIKEDAKDDTREELIRKISVSMGMGLAWERRAKNMGHGFIISWILFLAYALFIH